MQRWYCNVRLRRPCIEKRKMSQGQVLKNTYRYALRANVDTTVSQLVQQELGNELEVSLDYLYRLGSIYVHSRESEWPNKYIKPVRLFHDTDVKRGDTYLLIFLYLIHCHL